MVEKDSFVKICKVSDLPEGRGVRIEIEDFDLAIFKINNEVFVISNICPHNHTAQMFNGYLNEYAVSCPIHGWIFDLRNGKTLSNNSNIKTYETKIEDDYLFVKLPKSFFKW
ncbi:MAG: nitrite reductase (NAD(P)H) small subunit [Ignavibacteria bacterium]|jgi:NAD(P)H-dependent nitrite reductase small subunit|nr:nitrite reductase (NAD(P)H) small subunit [Ignavibacteria bacterium]MDH7528681.1 nitrite reductase (NAD(P)H) small subunit [Ignavibacteria bacterium]